MGRKPGMIYFPLDVEFFDNDKILTVGERPGWLYLAMNARAKKLLTDGLLTRLQIERLHISGWQKRLDALVDAKLVMVTDDGRYLIIGFLERNMSAAQVAAKRAADRDRKGADSERNPSGIHADPKRSEGKVEREGSEVAPATHQGLRVVGGGEWL